MALDTYAGLKASVASWATRSDQTTNIPDFVFWAHQEICRRLRANVMLASVTLTLSAETISQPTRFVAFRRLFLNVSPRRVIETVSPESAMDLSSRYSSDTYPTAVSIEGTLLRFSPAASGTTTTASALYYQEPALMTADADTNTVFAKYPYLYLWGALEALFNYTEDADNAQNYGGKFGALIEDINLRDAKDAMSGPLNSSPYPGGIV